VVDPQGLLWPASKVRRLAVAVGLLQTGFVTWVLWTSGYFRDDYVFMSLGRQGGFSETQLTRTVFGSLVPGFQFGNSLLASFHPIPRWPAIVIPMLLYALALFLFFRLAELLFGTRPIIVLLMAMAGLSGVLATSLVWWTAGLNSLPAVVCDLLAIDGLARHAATGKRRYLVVSVLSFAVGVSFYDASSSFVAVLVVFTALFLVEQKDWWGVMRGVARRSWLWAGYAVPIALNLFWRNLHPSEYTLAPFPSIGTALRFVGAGWAQGFIPSTLGISFSGVAQGFPRWLLVIVGQCLFFGIVAASVYRHRAAWKAWVMFGSGFAAIEILAAVGRAGDGTLFAINTVYWTAQPFVLALTLGLAFLPSNVGFAAANDQSSHRTVWKGDRTRIETLIGVAIVTVCVLGARTIWTSPDRTQGAMNHAYIGNLRQTWGQVQGKEAHPFVWNTQVPSFVLTPLFAPYNRVETTAGLLMDLRIDGTRGAGYLVSPDGRLIPATAMVISRAEIGSPTAGPASTPRSISGTDSAGGLCLARQATDRIESVALSGAIPPGNWFLRLGYTGSSGFSTKIGGQPVHFARGRGEFVFPDSPSVGTSDFSIKIPTGEAACITEADFEAPVATTKSQIGPTAPSGTAP
jgi:hypothetical protein